MKPTFSDRLLWHLRWRFSWNWHKLFSKEVTINTHQGLLTVPCWDDVLGKSLYCARHHEYDMVLDTLRHMQHVRPDWKPGEGTVLDIGANIGPIAVGMLYNRFFRTAVAFEPEPRNYSLLQRNIAQNGFQDRILSIQNAISDRAGELEFELSKINSGDHRVHLTPLGADPERHEESRRRIIRVPADTLDALLAKVPTNYTENIVLVWIDVQGYEGYVFRGGKQLFSRRPVVMSELWPYGIRRAGMSILDFCSIISESWSDYWVLEGEQFVKHATTELPSLCEKLDTQGDHANILLS